MLAVLCNDAYAVVSALSNHAQQHASSPAHLPACWWRPFWQQGFSILPMARGSPTRRTRASRWQRVPARFHAFSMAATVCVVGVILQLLGSRARHQEVVLRSVLHMQVAGGMHTPRLTVVTVSGCGHKSEHTEAITRCRLLCGGRREVVVPSWLLVWMIL
jgi:hypothetical protein